jgi:hypothetical protein
MRVLLLFLKVLCIVTVLAFEGLMFFFGCALTFTEGYFILGFSMIIISLSAIITEAIEFAKGM